ncbi:PREDICTED: mevalonate kinase-like [Cyphomyrmex costatus]|nr:PREDICTED: mevalonate kinase-like [Cyphomyrmex costatus]
MYRFNLSAPGTVFLCGDPNRFDKICIAASLNKCTKLSFSSFPQARMRTDFIRINFSDIQLDIKIPMRLFFMQLFREAKNNKCNVAELNETVKKFVLTSISCFYDKSNDAHKSSLHTFFFLLVLIAIIERINITSSFIVNLSTKLPIGEGLGSSASFAVCLAACFVRWSLLQKGIVVYEFRKHDLENILQYAQYCDFFIYNSSTEIATMISTYGRIQVFGEREVSESTLKSFPNLPSMKILLVFSNVCHHKTTIKLLSERRVQMEALGYSSSGVSTLIDFILNSIELMSTKFIHTLDIIDEKMSESKKHESSQSVDLGDNYKTLLDIIHMNQGLLKALDVSHPNMDIICAIARSFSFAGNLASKGGGGYAFILLLNDMGENIQKLITMLKSHDFSAEEVTINCCGITVE